MTDGANGEPTTTTGERRPPTPTPAPAPAPAPAHSRRMPLIIGAIAYGLLAWMVLVVFALIAWRLSGA